MHSKKRVLVIEDDPDVVIFVKDSLEYMDFDVLVARDGLKGLEKARTEKPDLVILDVMMPEMDGYEVCRRLRADIKTQRLLILMLTAKGKTQDKVKGLDIGADDYLAKPYELEEFERRVKALLRRTSSKDDKFTGDEIPTLFLSYAHADAQQVEKLYQVLTRQGYKPWMDKHDIAGGEVWRHAIDVAIDQSELFVPILSNNSVDRRGMIIVEIKKALEKWRGMKPSDIYVIPVRLDDCPIPELIQDIQVIDWIAGKGKAKLFKAIDVAMKRRNQ
jgi:two-component system, OmpR family, alkaline phosphatase synthesis response regulator PhoP